MLLMEIIHTLHFNFSDDYLNCFFFLIFYPTIGELALIAIRADEY